MGISGNRELYVPSNRQRKSSIKQARHNLCVVAVERGRLEEAEECLLEVRKMAPELEYVERHLEIVRNRIKLAGETTTSKDFNEEVNVDHF